MHTMKRTITACLALVLISCGGSQSAEELWSRAENDIAARRHEGAVKALNTLVRRYPDHSLASRAQFRIGDLYLNNTNDIPSALAALRSTIDNYPETDDGVKALFMMGFVYANHLGEFDAAQQAYQEFLDSYPNHELIPSVKFELENMGKKVEDIDILKDVVNAS